MSITKRQRDKTHKSFVMLLREMLRNKEWRKLNPAAREVYLQLKCKYNGSNNGQIHLHYSELKDIEGLKAPSTISKAFKELEEKDWIKRTKIGGLYRYFNEYELTGKYDGCIKKR